MQFVLKLVRFTIRVKIVNLINIGQNFVVLVEKT